MSKILYRETKGYKLTSEEVDSNFRWIEQQINKISEYCNMPLHIEHSGNAIKIINSLNKDLIASIEIPILIYRGSWSENIDYKKNDVIDYDSKRWQAINHHRSENVMDKKNWKELLD